MVIIWFGTVSTFDLTICCPLPILKKWAIFWGCLYFVLVSGYPMYNLLKRVVTSSDYFSDSSYWANLADFAVGIGCSVLLVGSITLTLWMDNICKQKNVCNRYRMCGACVKVFNSFLQHGQNDYESETRMIMRLRMEMKNGIESIMPRPPRSLPAQIEISKVPHKMDDHAMETFLCPEKWDKECCKEQCKWCKIQFFKCWDACCNRYCKKCVCNCCIRDDKDNDSRQAARNNNSNENKNKDNAVGNGKNNLTRRQLENLASNSSVNAARLSVPQIQKQTHGNGKYSISNEERALADVLHNEFDMTNDNENDVKKNDEEQAQRPFAKKENEKERRKTDNYPDWNHPKSSKQPLAPKVV